MEKFDRDEDGLYYQHRMEMETQKRATFSENRRRKGEKGGQPPFKQTKEKNHMVSGRLAVGLATDNHMGNENRNEKEDHKDSKNSYAP